MGTAGGLLNATPKNETNAQTIRRDIEAIPVIIEGIPWLRGDHRQFVRHLTMEPRALLGHLTPFRSAARSIWDLDPELVEVPTQILTDEIRTAEGNGNPDEVAAR